MRKIQIFAAALCASAMLFPVPACAGELDIDLTEGAIQQGQIAIPQINIPESTQSDAQDTLQQPIDIAGDASSSQQPAEPTGDAVDIDLTETEPQADLILSGGLTAAATEDGIDRYRTGWTRSEGSTRYILSNGKPATGVIEIDGDWYLFDEEGNAPCGWTKYEGRDVYCFLGGQLASGVVEIGDDLYLFDRYGHPVSGWMEEDGILRFGDKKGRVKTGWFKESGNTYLAMEDGSVTTGWILYDGNMYYQSDSGIATGLYTVDGQHRLFRDDGVLASGIVEIGGIRYLADADGFPVSGMVETPEGYYGTNANGMLLTGWQTVDGELHHFEPDGLATRGAIQTNSGFIWMDEQGRPVAGEIPEDDGSLCVTYDAPLYEGELPDPDNISVAFTRPLFGMQIDETDPIPDGEGWSEEAYGTSVLGVRTGLGTGSIEVPVIPVDHVEAEYDGDLYPGDTPVIQQVSVTAVYEDGKRSPVDTFTCELPENIEKDTEARVYSDFGNATLQLSLTPITNLHAAYNGSVREGELPDPSKYTVWTILDSGEKQDLDSFRAEKKRIFKNTRVTVEAGGVTTKCRIHCSAIEGVTVAGILYDNDPLSNRNLVVRYEDGGIETWYPGDYTWNGTPQAVLGESFRAITFMDRRYTAYLDVLKKNTDVPTQGIYYNTNMYPYASRTSLGIWTLTAYADTPHDQGPYVGQTASGAALVEGRTVAVSKATMDRLGLHFGDRLEINGHVYTIEDHGGSAMENQNWVDIFVSDPAREYDAAYNTPSEVFLLR